MKTMRWAGIVVGGIVAATGCTGTVAGGNGGGDPGTSSSSSSSSSGRPITCPPPEPQNHRPAATACAPSSPSTPCTTDADCVQQQATGQLQGKCSNGACDFNACATDADCAGSGEVCSCEGQSYGWGHSSPGSVCVPGNCRTDADCGPAGYCSPTVDATCGSFYGTVGFYCHGCQDTCIDDSDCPASGGSPAGYCAYDPSVGHWACGYSFCAG